jgi:serine/threonine protein kinase
VVLYAWRAQVSETVSAQPIMTPLWAAPEVVAKQPASIKADMWSYGEPPACLPAWAHTLPLTAQQLADGGRHARADHCWLHLHEAG